MARKTVNSPPAKPMQGSVKAPSREKPVSMVTAASSEAPEETPRV